jgi:hypothetical protein
MTICSCPGCLIRMLENTEWKMKVEVLEGTIRTISTAQAV